jgi:succinoglycan biosynthesis transport protein ExoP
MGPINSRSFEYQQLKREADADKTLYDELIRKIREADINAGFQNNNIRIADVARPPLHPVFPNVRLNLLLAFLFSTLLAVGAALVARHARYDTPRSQGGQPVSRHRCHWDDAY